MPFHLSTRWPKTHPCVSPFPKLECTETDEEVVSADLGNAWIKPFWLAGGEHSLRDILLNNCVHLVRVLEFHPTEGMEISLSCRFLPAKGSTG